MIGPIVFVVVYPDPIVVKIGALESKFIRPR